MGKKIYVPPKKPRLKSGGGWRMAANQHNSLRRNKQAPDERNVHPDEGQQQAASELDPSFVNPDGSINFWATLNTTPAKEDEPEEK